MPRYPWTDGPEYITQCPIQPGSKFTQKIILSTEEGTLWWHAHSDWTRATVHGAIIIYPKNGTKYPFRKPNAEVPIILGISVVTFKGQFTYYELTSKAKSKIIEVVEMQENGGRMM